MNRLTSGDDFMVALMQHNIHYVAYFYTLTKGTPRYSPAVNPNKEKYQPARRREFLRRSPKRQNSNRWGFATGSSSGFALVSSSEDWRGSAARAISSSPNSMNHAERSASARSSIHCSMMPDSCLRLLAALFSCLRWNVCRRVLEISKSHESGGSFGSRCWSFTRVHAFLHVEKSLLETTRAKRRGSETCSVLKASF